MGASAAFDTTNLPVEPGGEAEVQLRVRNTGSVVDSFTFEAVGLPGDWVTVEPSEIRLFPETEEYVTVRVRPTRTADTPLGELTFALRVISAEDPDGSVAEELTLVISEFGQRFGELHPKTSTGRRKGVHELAVDNYGNTPIEPVFAGVDPDNLFEFEFKPPSAVVEPGAAAIAILTVKPRKRFWRGKPKSLPFQVSITQGDEEPEILDGNFVQQPMVPPWFWKLLLAILALLILFWLLWQMWLKPTVESAARDSVEELIEEEVEELDERLDAAGIPEVGEAPPPPPAGGGGAPSTTEPPVPATTTSTVAVVPTTTTVPPTTIPGETTTTVATTTTTIPPVTDEGPIDFRIQVFDAADGPPGVGVFNSIAEGTKLEITDIIFQNPTGATGEVQVMRNGVPLLAAGLSNFRNLDYHFVAPYVFEPTDQVEVWVWCVQAGPLRPALDEGAPGQCRVAVSFAGFIVAD